MLVFDGCVFSTCNFENIVIKDRIIFLLYSYPLHITKNDLFVRMLKKVMNVFVFVFVLLCLCGVKERNVF